MPGPQFNGMMAVWVALSMAVTPGATFNLREALVDESEVRLLQ